MYRQQKENAGKPFLLKINIVFDFFSFLFCFVKIKPQLCIVNNCKKQITMQDYKEQVKGEMLENLYDLCYSAHRNTSFSPEKKAISYVKEYSRILEKDLETLGENAGNYKEKFINKFSDWMRSKGNCLSSMITGPLRRI